MKTIFNPDGQLNKTVFDKTLMEQTHYLSGVLTAAASTQSPRLETTHFLMALNRIPDSITRTFFQERGFSLQNLEEGLAGCAVKEPDSHPPRWLTPDVLDNSAQKMVRTLEEFLEKGDIAIIAEGHLLLAIIVNLTPAVEAAFIAIRLDHSKLPDQLREELEKIEQFKKPVPFNGEQLVQDAFTPGGQRVLYLMQTEAGALGFSQIDPRHLALALLEFEGGATQTAIYQQNLLPKKIQEKVMINLRGQARKKHDPPELVQKNLSTELKDILQAAAGETAAERCDKIAEVHLLRAFLNYETFSRLLLSDAGLDIEAARDTARLCKPCDEPVPAGMGGMQTLETIEANLQAALVGQQEVINACLPIIRRLVFGFLSPGKPAGVFMFCGPSGMGKTEMAKALARSVFGSDDHLIMLEMGQFQTKESMNIFVGAPPGYVGYGEGKLTNGLRDKPKAVVLFDEVEKAHPEVFDALLRFIDEGQIDDPAGPCRNGSECIIVLTSNVRTDGLDQLISGDGYKRNKWEIRRKLKEALLNLPVESDNRSRSSEPFRFRPELLNRIDEIILFRNLSEEDFAEIARRYLLENSHRLEKEKQVQLNFSPNLESTAKLIGHFSTTMDEGARAVHRLCHSSVINPVIDFVLNEKCTFPVSLDIYFPQALETSAAGAAPRALIKIVKPFNNGSIS
jgi:ATP-dependent Clp protease ATP-binding subunit ClpA